MTTVLSLKNFNYIWKKIFLIKVRILFFFELHTIHANTLKTNANTLRIIIPKTILLKKLKKIKKKHIDQLNT